MDEKLAKMLRERLAAPAPGALETARDFLMHYVHDSDYELLERDVRGMMKVNPNVIVQAVEAIEALLTTPQPPETLYKLVAYDANWMLEDDSEAGASAWLRDLANRLRQWLGEHAP
jgi:hypothetical protein